LFKKLICLIAVLTMLAGTTACRGKKDNITGGEGINKDFVYVEEQIGRLAGLEVPGMIRMDSQNRLVVHNAGAESPEYLIIGPNGEIEQKINCGFIGQGDVFTLDLQDNLYIAAKIYGESGYDQKIYIVDKNGEILKTINIWPVSYDNIGSYVKTVTGISVDSNGDIVLSCFENSITVLDKDGSEKNVLGDELYQGIAQFDGEGNTIVCGKNTSDYQIRLWKYNTAEAKKIWEKPIEREYRKLFGEDVKKLLCGLKDGSIYLLTDAGIEKFDKDGNYLERAVDFKNYTILASGNIITDMCIDTDGTFYVLSVKGGSGGIIQTGGDTGKVEYELYKYSLQPAGADDKIPVTISVPSSGRLLDVAIGKFNRENPGYRIEVREFAAGQGEEGYDRYVNTLNTELMSGKGPDIISVSGLSYEKYIDKNVFADLTQMMINDTDFQTDRYFTNIFDAMKINGKLYNMPIHAGIYALFASKKEISKRNILVDDRTWSWSDFFTTADRVLSAGSDNVYIVPPNVSHMNMLEMMQGYLGNFVDMEKRKAEFDSDAFIEILQTAEKLGTDMEIETGGDAVLHAMYNSYDRGSILFSLQYIEDIMMLSTAKVFLGGEISILIPPHLSGEVRGGSFDCGESFAINANSKNKEIAWEFIKILLSDEIQSMDELAGFPVNRAAFKTQAARHNELLTSESATVLIGFSRDGEPVTPEALSDWEVSELEEYIEKLTEYCHIDRKIRQIIQAEAEGYFSGIRTAKETAIAIQNKVNTYLGE